MSSTAQPEEGPGVPRHVGPADADAAASARDLVVQLALTDAALRSTAEAGKPTADLALEEDALLDALHEHGLDFQALSGASSPREEPAEESTGTDSA